MLIWLEASRLRYTTHFKLSLSASISQSSPKPETLNPDNSYFNGPQKFEHSAARTASITGERASGFEGPTWQRVLVVLGTMGLGALAHEAPKP